MTDLCLIIAPQNKDTILDRIAHEIGKGFKTPIYHYGNMPIPRAEKYFVTHYSLLPNVLMQVNPLITPVICLFTHDKGGLKQYVDSFNLCHAVVAESPQGTRILKEIGVHNDIVHFVPEGGDSISFKPHARSKDGAVLVCGTNYADGRKNSELAYKVQQLLPNRKFIFIGKNWSTKDDVSYQFYPDAYKQCSVYLSCSKLEGGGPNSLIEAMHANIVPVVSDTGNAREYIVDGYNGFIFDKDATPEQVAELIEQAYQIEPQNSIPYSDIWQTVAQFTWENYSIQIREIIFSDYTFTNSQELNDDDNDSTN